MCKMVVFIVYLQVFLLASYAFADNNRTFPQGFMFGVSTAAYQIEGAWKEDSKGESIWDHYVHQTPSVVDDNQTADVACDSYHKYQEDVALIADMGLSHYRFSLAWARILPTGFNNEVNFKGIMYYQNLIQLLVKRNITPVVTLYHWDLPESLQDLGGWLNPRIVDYFVDYARVVFTYLGDEATYWITVNDPKQVCTGGYGQGSMAPGYNLSGEADYICAYNILKAHAAVYHLYKNLTLDGKISISIDGSWSEPASTNVADQEASERRLAFELGLYADPVFKGNWPKVVIDRVQERSSKENFTSSRLPAFTDEEISYINGTADFMALNFYYGYLVADAPEAEYGIPGLDKDIKVNTTKDPDWPEGSNGNAIVPEMFKKFLRYMKSHYGNPAILITENGVGDDGSTLHDDVRMKFLADYLSSMLDAMNDDGVNVFGYTHWSLLDNFEWKHGYKAHFGLYSVNFSDPNRTRTPKSSAEYYRQIATTLVIPEPPVTVSTTPKTSEVTPNTTEVTTNPSTQSSSETDSSSTDDPEISTKPGSAFGIHKNVPGVVVYLIILLCSFKGLVRTP